MYAAIKKFKDEFQSVKSDARISTCKRVRTDQHDRPNGRNIERLADPDGVADDNISLKLFNLFAADDLVLECTKTGRDAIRDFAAFE